ncbi:MAG: type IV toxin-antitoxin system AbiEi family antitoxin [Mycobacterium sp.]
MSLPSRKFPDMGYRSEPFIGSEAIANLDLTRGELRWNHRALLPDVYLHKDAPRDLRARTRAAWLWTGRKGIIAGQAAAAIHTRGPLDDDTPVELIARARRPQCGVIIRTERIDADEIAAWHHMLITSPERTALDLARFLPRELAIQHLDRLAAKTAVTEDDLYRLADRYRGARGIDTARQVMYLMDAGAANPEESTLRLALHEAGLPRPETDINVGVWPDSARISLGWRRFKVGIHVESDPPPTDRTLINLAAAAAERRAIHGWLILTATPQRDVGQLISSVRQALRQARARTPG